jgi:hypothetical protein
LEPNSEKAQGITSWVARLFDTHLRTMSLVKGEGFRGRMAEVCPEYEIPSRNTVASSIRARPSDIRNDVPENLKQVQVAWTVDFWLSVAMDSYMGVTYHYIDEEWLFRSILLQNMEVRFPHGENHSRSSWRYRKWIECRR